MHHLTSRACLTAATLICVAATLSTNAQPIPEESLIWIRQFENENATTPAGLTNQITTNTTFSNTFNSVFGSDAQATGSLATASVGTRYTRTTLGEANGQSLVALFDTITFDTPGNVNTTIEYDVTLDGTLANSSIGSTSQLAAARATTRITIVDITGIDEWIETFSTPEDPVYSTNAPLVSNTSINLVVGNQLAVDTFSPFFDQAILDTSGTIFNFDESKQASFIADPTKEYGIIIQASSEANGIAASDFLSTAQFQFTNLNGATFQSGSGSFLQNNTTAIPEPASITLRLTAAAAITRRSKRRNA